MRHIRGTPITTEKSNEMTTNLITGKTPAKDASQFEVDMKYGQMHSVETGTRGRRSSVTEPDPSDQGTINEETRHG